MRFIERVLEEKAAEIARKASRHPIAEMRESLKSTHVRDFRCAFAADAWGGHSPSIIAELKAKTPSIDSFVHSAALFELAETYQASGAAAVSVVTDTYNFGTTLEDVQSVRRRISLPVLVKDFVIDPYQIFEARAHGADAVLLIARILDRDRLVEFLDLVRRLGMSALVETHDEAEVEMALEARCDIVGINNRDLDTLDVSLDTTRRLVALVPDDVIVVAESGIRTRADVENLALAGVNAFLVGGTLLDAEDPGLTLRSLRGEVKDAASPPGNRSTFNRIDH